MNRTLLILVAALAACSNPKPPSTTDAATTADATTADVTAPDAATPSQVLEFGQPGSLAQPAGKGSFRFGAATAAAQIEDGLLSSDWHFWTLPEADGGLGKGKGFVGDAVRGATRAIGDVALLEEMNLDSYRFSVAWDRIEPARDQIEQAGLDHYDGLIDALVATQIRPMITVHHFSSPIWVEDFRTPCADSDSPTDENLCGWDHPDGVELIIEELAEHAALLARTYGDRVDDWCTLNEPVNYLFASYGVGIFPPGERHMLLDFERFKAVFSAYLRGHVAIYDAIKANDLVDADGDGAAANVGFSLSVVDWVPARGNKASDNPDDIAAADRTWYVYHHLYPDALIQGGLDTDLDGTIDEQHPDWKGKLDWLGAQYYFRAGVTATVQFFPGINGTICFAPLDGGACIPPEDDTKWVPSMKYEFFEPGLHKILVDLGARYPDLPLVVTEGGIATEVGARRAENAVRSLEQIAQAQADGVDVRGYYHWSLVDNFEWAEGFEPKFGLYSVDLTTFERTATEGAQVFGAVAGARELSDEVRAAHGGIGPMTPEL